MSEQHGFASVAELSASVGRRLGPTAWQEVSTERIRQFADVTGDHQWIHVDEVRARVDSPFGGTIAHGALTLSLVTVFAGTLLQVRAARSTVNGGLRHARLRAPVLAGSQLRGWAEILDCTPIAGAVVVIARIQVEVLNSRVPACLADQVMVIHE